VFSDDLQETRYTTITAAMIPCNEIE